MSDTQEKQHWGEAVVACVSDKAERERLIRFYNYDELVQACLALGTLALTAKTEYTMRVKAEREVAELREALKQVVEMDRSAMYQRCPDCDGAYCDTRKECYIVPLSAIGRVAKDALETEPHAQGGLV